MIAIWDERLLIPNLLGEADSAANDNANAANDTLNGGDGDDVMVGDNSTDITAQTLSAGQTDHDSYFCGVGNDKLYGEGAANSEYWKEVA